MYGTTYRRRWLSCAGRLLALVLVLIVSIAAGGQINGWWDVMGPIRDERVQPAAPANRGAEAAAVAAQATAGGALQPTRPAREPEAVRAPAFALPDLLNPQASVTLTAYAGQPVILNFWASWCLPCREEMPALQRAYLAHQNDGLMVVGVNQLYQDDLDAAQAFVKERGLSFPQAADESGQVSEDFYRIIGLPTSVFITSSGEIAHRHIGQMSEAQIERYSQQLINEGSITP